MRIKKEFRRLYYKGTILKYLIALLLIFPLQVKDCFAYGKVVIESNKPLLSQFNKENTTYVIKSNLNLEGATLSLPHKCSLLFEGGEIANGTLVGNETRIKGENGPIFQRVQFEGSFLGTIKESWFPLRYGDYYDNSFELNSALNLTHLSDNKSFRLAQNKVLYVRSDVDNSRWPTYLREGTVEVKSGVTFDLNGTTIKCMTNSSHQYNILFSKDQHDICIKNGTVCGDLEAHTGKDGQWGHGIALEGVSNYIIENVECTQCWGDGVNLQVSHNGDGIETSSITMSGHCMNGRLINVRSYHNRRQGMTIGGAIYLDVVDCEFSYTKGTNPQSGVDIEPNKPVNVVSHVTFQNCLFASNEHQGLTLSGESIYDINIKNNEFRSNGGYDISVRGKKVNIDNCYVTSGYEKLKVRFVADAEDVNVSNCILSSIYAQHSKVGETVKGIRIKDCKFDWTRSDVRAGLYDDKKLMVCTMVFERCDFDFRTLSAKVNMSFVTSNDAHDFRFNNCRFDGAGRDIDVASSLRFSGCVFENLNRVVCKIGASDKNVFDFSGCTIRDVKGKNVFELDAPRGSRYVFNLSNTKVEDSTPSLLGSSVRAEVQIRNRGAALPKEDVAGNSKGRVKMTRVQ